MIGFLKEKDFHRKELQEIILRGEEQSENCSNKSVRTDETTHKERYLHLCLTTQPINKPSYMVEWFLTQVPRVNGAFMFIISTNGSGKAGYPHAKIMMVDSTLKSECCSVVSDSLRPRGLVHGNL